LTKTALEKFSLKLNVHPVVYEFFTFRFHTDVIEISPNDTFSIRVKTILQLQPKTYEAGSPKIPLQYYKTLTLLLPRAFDVAGKRIATEYRNNLDNRRQFLLSRELHRLFKDIFHKYVLAYCRGKKLAPGCQKEAIEDFCFIHNLKLNKINYEMLKKSWYRSDEKQFLNRNFN